MQRALRIVLCVGTSFAQLFAQGQKLHHAPRREVTNQERLAPGPKSEDLLMRSYATGKQFVPDERAAHLVFLTQVAADANPEMARRWAEEAFKLTSDLPMSWNRGVAQRNVLVQLARVDPARALQLLGSMDIPVPQVGGSLTEDLRASAAQAVFLAAWRKTGAKNLGVMQREAQHIGETGQYPYKAMANIISGLAPRDSARAHSLFSEALAYYRRGSKFRSTNLEYLEFLREVRPYIQQSLVRSALEIFVAEVSKSPEPEKGENWVFQIETDKGVAALRSPAERLLFEVLPMIREIDAEWAQRIVDTRPQLRQASGTGARVQRVESALVKQLPDSHSDERTISQIEQHGLEMSRLRNIQAMASEKPDEALTLSWSLTDPALRTMALAQVATSLSDKSPERAAKVFRTSEELLGGLESPSDKLRALTAVAEAAAALGESESVRSALQQGFDLGEELFQEDVDQHPTKPAILSDAFKQLHKLTQLGIRVQSPGTLARLDSLRNEVLQGYLLISAAQALQDLHRP